MSSHAEKANAALVKAQEHADKGAAGSDFEIIAVLMMNALVQATLAVADEIRELTFAYTERHT